MQLIENLLRKLFIYISFPHNLKKEKISDYQIKIIDELNIKIKNLIIKNSDTKLKTHKIFSETVLSLIHKKKLSNFLREPFIQKMFFVHNRFYNIKFLNKILKNKPDIWNKLLIENPVGNPVPFFLFKKSSGNRIRHVFLLKKIFEYCQINKVDSVIELGGGYGCMAKIFNDLDNSVNYTIFDLPEVNLLQYYYLKSNKINFKFDDPNEIKVITSKINLLEEKIKIFKKENKKIMIVANWSLSEMPLSLRKKLEFLFENCNFGLISYQSNFEEICNKTYFESLKEKLIDKFLFKNEPIKEMNGIFNANKHFLFLMKKNDKN